jgi:hypothetical protein
MKMDLYIGGEKKTFVVPFVPMQARRKFLELEARAETRTEAPSKQEEMDENDEMLSILSDIVFQKQFSLEELYNGASKEYIDEKLLEAVFNIKPKDKKDDSGNGERE